MNTKKSKNKRCKKEKEELKTNICTWGGGCCGLSISQQQGENKF
jgi:hypothetical protein